MIIINVSPVLCHLFITRKLKSCQDQIVCQSPGGRYVQWTFWLFVSQSCLLRSNHCYLPYLWFESFSLFSNLEGMIWNWMILSDNTCKVMMRRWNSIRIRSRPEVRCNGFKSLGIFVTDTTASGTKHLSEILSMFITSRSRTRLKFKTRPKLKHE